MLGTVHRGERLLILNYPFKSSRYHPLLLGNGDSVGVNLGLNELLGRGSRGSGFFNLDGERTMVRPEMIRVGRGRVACSKDPVAIWLQTVDAPKWWGIIGKHNARLVI